MHDLNSLAHHTLKIIQIEQNVKEREKGVEKKQEEKGTKEKGTKEAKEKAAAADATLLGPIRPLHPRCSLLGPHIR